MTDHDSRVPVAELAALVTAILIRHGARPDEARIQTDHWLEGDLRGQHSHGIQRLPTVIGRIASGRLRTDSTPTYTWLSDPVLEVEAGHGFGPVVAHGAIGRIMQRAQETGVAVALLRDNNHLGMLAPYVERMATVGDIGMVLTTTEALVHPWGGADAMVGTNPIAIGVPTTADAPLVLDMATSATSRGRVLKHARTSTPLERGWAVDSHGHPTTDARAAIDGALSPFGGPKGYALGIALGTMVATLTGTGLGRGVVGTLDETHASTKGDVIMCFDPHRLGRSGESARTASYLNDVRGSRPSDHRTPIWTPGDRARQTRTTRLAEGIPVDHALLSTLHRLANAPKDVT